MTGPIIGYEVGGRVYPPEDVTVVRRLPNRPNPDRSVREAEPTFMDAHGNPALAGNGVRRRVVRLWPRDRRPRCPVTEGEACPWLASVDVVFAITYRVPAKVRLCHWHAGQLRRRIGPAAP